MAGVAPPSKTAILFANKYYGAAYDPKYDAKYAAGAPAGALNGYTGVDVSGMYAHASTALELLCQVIGWEI